MTANRNITVAVGQALIEFDVTITRNESTYPSYLSEQCANFSIIGGSRGEVEMATLRILTPVDNTTVQFG